MAREIEIQILGKPLTFSLAEGIDHMEFLQMVDYVETKFTRIKGKMNELDSFKLGLLVSINIAQDFFNLKKENEKFYAILGKIDTLLTPENDEDQLPIRISS
jgi:cell division protein ZapA (FtsZ GTPase activity inhibitor)